MTEPTALRVQRTFNAPARDVFDALVNPEVMRRWWHAGEDWETPHAEADPRPGGRFRVVMRRPDGRNTPALGNTPSSTRRAGWPSAGPGTPNRPRAMPRGWEITLDNLARKALGARA
jgi:uncharacterized protein YndB with AHSA1/START domain